MQTRTGSCLCGAVRYQVRGEPLVARLCWCRVCQKISGNGTANAIFQADAIEVEGATARFVRRADSGNEIASHFCAACGCQLFAGSSANPQLRVVRLGTLDDPSSIRPSINMWTASAPTWACLDPALASQAQQPAPLQARRPPDVAT